MKRLLLKSMLLLCALVAGSSSVWADDKSIESNFTSKDGAVAEGELKWTTTNVNKLESSGDARGVQSNKSTTDFVLTSNAIQTIGLHKISQVIVTASANGASSIKVQVGGKDFGSSTSLPNKSKNVDFTFSGTAAGQIVVTIGSASNCTKWVKKITVKYDDTVYPVNVSSAEYATFNYAGSKALDFSSTGITVYTAEDKATSVALNEVTSGKVPANTPVVLYKAGASGTAVNVPVIASADAITGTNDLVVSTGAAIENAYVLAKKTKGVGFYKWDGTTLSAGKIFLQAKAAYAPAFLGFGDVTAVESVKAQRAEQQEYYNLAGQRVAQPTKGLYIVNGKKVVIK